jgi:hypothetical protein
VTFIETTPPFTMKSTDLFWKWWGGGPSLGADLSYSFGKGFGLFAEGALALLLGRIKEKETYFLIASNLAPELDTNKYRFSSLQPQFNFELGVDFNHQFRKTLQFHLATSWEIIYWLFLNQFGRVRDPGYSNNFASADSATFLHYFDVSPSGLGLQGLKIHAELRF